MKPSSRPRARRSTTAAGSRRRRPRRWIEPRGPLRCRLLRRGRLRGCRLRRRRLRGSRASRRPPSRAARPWRPAASAGWPWSPAAAAFGFAVAFAAFAFRFVAGAPWCHGLRPRPSSASSSPSAASAAAPLAWSWCCRHAQFLLSPAAMAGRFHLLVRAARVPRELLNCRSSSPMSSLSSPSSDPPRISAWRSSSRSSARSIRSRRAHAQRLPVGRRVGARDARPGGGQQARAPGRRWRDRANRRRPPGPGGPRRAVTGGAPCIPQRPRRFVPDRQRLVGRQLGAPVSDRAAAMSAPAAPAA